MFADTIFRNGQVVTVNACDEVVTAIAVQGNRILAVGDDTAVMRWAGPTTRVVDLAGRALLPGLIDAHAHFTLLGANAVSADCKNGVKTIADVLDRLREQAAKTPKGQWVRGWGYNDFKLAERRHPTREELDSITTDHPVMLVRTCTHISVANSVALRMAGIDETTANPPGGEIGRDEQGIPNGLLKETAHMRLYQMASFGEAEIRAALKRADALFHEVGITSVHDAGSYGETGMRTLAQAVLQGDVKTRIYAIWGALDNCDKFVESVLPTGIVTGIGDARFRIGPAKLFLDGSSSGPTCATRAPYTSQPDYNGILYYTPEQIDHVLGRAHRLGWQITAHAIGDKAVEMMVDAIERALASSPRVDHRHRIEHAGMVPPDLLARIKQLGIVPIPNPAFFHEFGDGYLANYGDERTGAMFPCGSYLREGIMAAGGSDTPVTTHNPFRGMATAMSRRTDSGQSTGEHERIQILQAIRLFTFNGAYASFEESIKGSLEPGKLADLVVLDGPILDRSPEEVAATGVHATMIDGEVVAGSLS